MNAERKTTRKCLLLVLIRRFLFRRLHKESWLGNQLDKIPPRLRPSALDDPWLGTDLWRVSLARILQRELNSCVGRIRWLLETELYQRMVVLDFVGQLAMPPKEAMRAQDGCSRDIGNLYAQFRWTTPVDARIFAEGWTRGALWTLRNVCNVAPAVSRFPRRPSISFPSEVPQESTHGQLAPLASRESVC